MPALYPPVDPYEAGLLDVGGGQGLYWETCGAADGAPALVLHGGPGSGCSPGMRRMFDPSRFRTVLFDQRNCGRSRPHAADPGADLAANTTAHQIADIERLRASMGIERWLVFGASWGAALGLAYAERHPERVSALVVSHASPSRHADFHWLYHGVGRFFPEAWARFRAGAGSPPPETNLIEAYHRRLEGPDLAVREKAARDWCDWEAAVISIDPRLPRPDRYADARFRMAFARIVTHYFSRCCWFEDGQLLRDAHRLANVTGAIVNGRLDLGNPIEGALALAEAWPGAELTIIDAAGHETQTPGVIEATIAAIERLGPRVGRA